MSNRRSRIRLKATGTLAGLVLGLSLIPSAAAAAEPQSELTFEARVGFEGDLRLPTPLGGHPTGTQIILEMGPIKVKRNGVTYRMTASVAKTKIGSEADFEVSFQRDKATPTTKATQLHGWTFRFPKKAFKTTKFPNVSLNTRKNLGKFGGVNVKFEEKRSRKRCKGKVVTKKGTVTGKLLFRSHNGFFRKVKLSSMRARLIRDRGCPTGFPCYTTGESILAFPASQQQIVVSRTGGRVTQFAFRSEEDGPADISHLIFARVPATHLTLSADVQTGSITTAPKTFFSGGASYVGVASPPDNPTCGGETYLFEGSNGTLTGDLKATFDGVPHIRLPGPGAEAEALRVSKL